MSIRSTRLAGLCLTAVLVSTAGAFAQLSDADIAALQQRGQQEGWTFSVAPNPATKLPVSALCGTVVPPDWPQNAHFDQSISARVDAQALPSSWDWRTRTGCPPIRNQGGCGSCWAFSTAGGLECAIRIKDGIDVDLAEQWLVRCNQSGWSCGGGWFAYDYYTRNQSHPSGVATDSCGGNGAVMETDDPYTATDGTCGCPFPHQYTIPSWAYVNSDVASIKQAIMDYGPVSVTIHGGDGPFQSYHSGVYNACYAGSDIDHAVVLVGWDDNQGAGGVWFLRNSWGTGWGEGGYMRIQYGCNNVAQSVCYCIYPGRSGVVTERVNLGASSVQATGGASGNAVYPRPATSADGRCIAFDSAATNLVTNDTNGQWDVFVRDRQAITTERVSVSSSGAQANGLNQGPVITPDGRFVAFYSAATNLVADDTNAKGDVYLRDRQSGTTELVSRAAGAAGAPGNADSGKRAGDANICGTIAISADGRYVGFVSSASNLVPDDTNGVDDVFVRDRENNTIERVSVDSNGAQAGAKSSYVAISADGRYVVFSSSAINLVTGDTNGVDDIFLRDRQANTTVRVSVANDRSQPTGGASDMPVISGDGRLVAFRSAATNLVAGDTNAKTDIFLRDVQASTTELVSVRTGGTQANDNCYLPSMSTDGRYVIFSSPANNLAASDSNGKTDVFLRDRQAGTTSLASVGNTWQQGTGSGTVGNTYGATISSGGRYVVFASLAANFVASDTNGLQDIFLHDCGAYQGLGPVAEQASVTVPEGGTGTLQVKLSRQPQTTQVVSVTPATAGTGFAVQSGASLTFTTSNWNTYQTVTIASAADSDTCNDTVSIRCAIVGGEFNDIPVTQQDHDLVTIVTAASSIPVPEGGTAPLQVKLNRQPCSNVTVSVAAAGGSAINSIQSGASLTFTTANWNTYQTVMLASAKDINAYCDSTTIRCSSTGLANVDVTVVQQDNFAADFDGDSDVDLDDFGHLQACMTGHGAAVTDPACKDADLDCNTWVDQADISLFMRFFNGAGKAPKVPQ